MKITGLSRIVEWINALGTMRTVVAASVAGVLSALVYWKTSFGKIDLHALCSYLSLGLPLLGFVALRESAGLTFAEYRANATREAGSRESPDQEVAADLIRQIEAERLETESHQQIIVPAPPVPTPGLSTSEFFWAALAKPQQVFLAIKHRPRLEALVFPCVFFLALPFSFRDPSVSFLTGYLMILAGLPFYELGKAGLLMIAARFFRQRVALGTALFEVMIMDLSPAVLFLLLLLFPALVGRAGPEFFFRPGLGDFVSDLAETHAVLFNLLAQVNLFALWSFFLWWTALAIVLGVRRRECVIVAVLVYSVVHVLLCPAIQVGRVLIVW